MWKRNSSREAVNGSIRESRNTHSSRWPVVELAAFAISAVIAIAVASQQFQLAAFSSLRLLASGILNTNKQAAAADNSPTKGERILRCDLLVLNHYLPDASSYLPTDGESPYISQWVAMRWSTEHGKYVAIWWSHVAGTNASKRGDGSVRVRKYGVVVEAPRMATIRSDYDMEVATREFLPFSERPAARVKDVRESTNLGVRMRLEEAERLTAASRMARGGAANGLERLPAVEDELEDVATATGRGSGSGGEKTGSR